MKPKPITEMTMEELQKYEKTMKTATIVLGICVGIMFIISISLITKGGFSVQTVLPFAFLPLFIMNMQNWKKAKAEIANRG
jgi:phosphoribosylformylglycinamidine (FGAM) synthase-like amidotransferase family enzyme